MWNLLHVGHIETRYNGICVVRVSGFMEWEILCVNLHDDTWIVVQNRSWGMPLVELEERNEISIVTIDMITSRGMEFIRGYSYDTLVRKFDIMSIRKWRQSRDMCCVYKILLFKFVISDNISYSSYILQIYWNISYTSVW